MKTKYQIFISSTFEDLKEERDLVIKAILEMGHIPVGMEMFSAGDEQQWELIKSQIDDCDYYVVISAFRYGSLDGDIGYTEKEYDYAVSKNVPVLGFVINNGVNWPANKIDKNQNKIKKLEAFKQKIQGKIVSYWDDKNDLYGKVSISLMKQFNTNPRAGWVKSSEQVGPEVLKEISRLSNENSELRKTIKTYEDQFEKDKNEEFQKTLETLKHNKRELAFRYIGNSAFVDKTEFTLLEIFNLLAPELMIENSTNHCIHYLGFMLKPDKDKNINSESAMPINSVRKILADLNVLEIIHPSNKKHSVKDENEYWSLTEQGKKLFKEVRREVMEKNLNNSSDEQTEEDMNEK
ncbi:DUF4062 domain-containing protein [uncultured Winogradskyella sp.]|uniref:DUF4062 domain-containing protein n=1 Tax=uncultured Winogradskyella sp. TaxID=395353 RepID=UPI00262F5DC8|nr:DUF4062 domain-containing protein [uncultured Winogradskyella sp.]